jgi:hypothetical protein
MAPPLPILDRLNRRLSQLGQSEVRSRLATVAVCFQFERYGLAVVQVLDASALESGNVNENVLRTMLRGDKAKTFGGVEPFHGAFSHRDVSYFSIATRRMQWPGSVSSESRLSRKGDSGRQKNLRLPHMHLKTCEYKPCWQKIAYIRPLSAEKFAKNCPESMAKAVRESAD